MRARVAIVEDNADNRLLASVLLEELYDVAEYESGPEALAAFDAGVPDLILLDISLPGMDGTEVLARLRADPRFATLPVVALTAHASAHDRARFASAGFDDCVTKPIVDERVLLDAVARQLSRAAR